MPSRMTPGSRRSALAIVALAALAVYANSLANGFAYDDLWIVLEREIVQGIGDWREILVSPYWPERFDAGLYRPFTLLTFAVDWELWNGSPFGFHLTNVLLHAGVTVLLTVLLLRLFPWWGALAGGLVFAVHPIHTEAVANVVGRGELLAGVFMLGACVIYAGATERNRFGAAELVSIPALYALGVFSKEIAIVLPALLVVTDLPGAVRRSVGTLSEYLRRRTALFSLMALVAAAYLAARWLVLGAAIEDQPDRLFTLDDSFPTRLFTMARVWPRYFELLFFPVELSADYSPAVILPADRLTPLGILGFALILATLMLAVAGFRRAPALTVAVLWAAITLLPVSNLIVMAEIVLAERTLYLPSVAVSIGAALAVARAPAPRRAWIMGAVALWILGFSAVTVHRNPVWRSTSTVFEDLRRKHPESSRLLWSLGEENLRRGDWNAARYWFDQSLAIWPYHSARLAQYAFLLQKRGELRNAERIAMQAVELRPDHGDYYLLLAAIRWQASDHRGAGQAVRQGLEIEPRDPDLHAAQANVLARAGEYEEAAKAQQRAIAAMQATGRDPGMATLRLAELLAAAGDTAAAVNLLLELRPFEGSIRVRAESIAAALGHVDHE